MTLGAECFLEKDTSRKSTLIVFLALKSCLFLSLFPLFHLHPAIFTLPSLPGYQLSTSFPSPSGLFPPFPTPALTGVGGRRAPRTTRVNVLPFFPKIVAPQVQTNSESEENTLSGCCVCEFKEQSGMLRLAGLVWRLCEKNAAGLRPILSLRILPHEFTPRL